MYPSPYKYSAIALLKQWGRLSFRKMRPHSQILIIIFSAIAHFFSVFPTHWLISHVTDCFLKVFPRP